MKTKTALGLSFTNGGEKEAVLASIERSSSAQSQEPGGKHCTGSGETIRPFRYMTSAFASGTSLPFRVEEKRI
jgi:hypothetical protein